MAKPYRIINGSGYDAYVLNKPVKKLAIPILP
jgi:hypothetical protein